MGTITGAPRVSSKDKREYLQQLAQNMNPLYTLKLGAAVQQGQTVVIPSMMRTPSTQSVGERQLTLGIGRVVLRDIVSTSMSPGMVASLPPDLKPYVKHASPHAVTGGYQSGGSFSNGVSSSAKKEHDP
jgi:hypothetical protein